MVMDNKKDINTNSEDIIKTGKKFKGILNGTIITKLHIIITMGINININIKVTSIQKKDL